ncbi:MAG: hypothetical protein FWC23_10630 [Chitinispirillia bacterium]|nr:hypothetical protein [Chitinispirillia bacterium]MCL2269622.1 hypothetical protein [Chitinispirillia bacterium]
MSILSGKRIPGNAKKGLKSLITVVVACSVLPVLSGACVGGKKVGVDSDVAAHPVTAEQSAAAAHDVHNPGDAVKDWKVALQYLKDGNKRFLEDQTMTRNTNAADRAVLKSGQKPFAVVITCADSRVSPEIYFDQKLGDIFVIRNAGNIASTAALGSIEYAVEHLHSPLVVVVGHSSCGAVNGAFEAKNAHKDEHHEGEHKDEHAVTPENLMTILNAITPVIANSANADDGIHANVAHVVDLIKGNNIVKHVKATVIGAYYNIETGEVSFKE